MYGLTFRIHNLWCIAVALGVGYGFEEVFELTLSSINAGRSERTRLLVHWSLSLVIVAALIMHAACQQRARGRERTRALTSGGINNEAEDGIEAEDGDDDDEVDDEEALLNLIDWLETIDDVEDANTDDCPTGNVPYTPLSE